MPHLLIRNTLLLKMQQQLNLPLLLAWLLPLQFCLLTLQYQFLPNLHRCSKLLPLRSGVLCKSFFYLPTMFLNGQLLGLPKWYLLHKLQRKVLSYGRTMPIMLPGQPQLHNLHVRLPLPHLSDWILPLRQQFRLWSLQCCFDQLSGMWP